MQLSKALTAAPGSVATDPLAVVPPGPTETPAVDFNTFMEQLIVARDAVLYFINGRKPLIYLQVEARLNELIASEGFYKYGQLFPIKTASGDGNATADKIGSASGSVVDPTSPEAVAAAIDALKLDASLWLHGPLFGRWMDLKRKDRYPPDAVARLAALRALTLPQLKYLKDGEGRPPI